MNRIKLLLILAGLLLGNDLKAQKNFEFNLHYAMPIGDFKQGEFSDFDSLGNIPTGKFGYAGNGVGMGFKVIIPFKQSGFNLIFGADGYVNGISKNIRDQYTNENIDGYSNRKIKFSTYYNLPLSLGVLYQKKINDHLAIYGQVTPSLSIFKISNSNYSIGAQASETFDYSYDWENSMGGEIRVGIEMNEKITLSVAYVNFGSQNVNRFEKHTINGISEVTQTKMVKKFAMISASLGFRF